MMIECDNKLHITELYLTTQDQSDPVLQAQLPAIIQRYKSEGYMVAVYRSGRNSLVRQTSDLLCHNRQAIARQTVAQQRAGR